MCRVLCDTAQRLWAGVDSEEVESQPGGGGSGQELSYRAPGRCRHRSCRARIQQSTQVLHTTYLLTTAVWLSNFLGFISGIFL